MPCGKVAPAKMVAVNMIGAVSPAARARPSSEPVSSPPTLCGSRTDQTICAAVSPSAGGGFDVFRGQAGDPLDERDGDGRQDHEPERARPPVSQTFPQPHHCTKTMKPKRPKRMLGTPLSTCRSSVSFAAVAAAAKIDAVRRAQAPSASGAPTAKAVASRMIVPTRF